MQAVLCGYYGYGNGGDEALLATLLQFLPKAISPVVLSSNPEFTQTLHGVPACDRNNLAAVVQLLRQSNYFIWGGGSLIQDATSALSPWYYCTLMLTAQALGLKTIAWAQGIGPLKRPLTRWIAQQAFTRCDRVSVRDTGSLEWIQRWQINALIAPDPVWALEASPTSPLPPSERQRLAVVLRSHPDLTPARLDQLGEALQQFQRQTQAEIVFLPFQESQDLAIAQTLHQTIPDSQVLMIQDPRQLKSVFKQVHMAIAMRLHGLIMAAAEGCRCFGISYDPKVRRLLDSLLAPGWDLHQWPPTTQSILEQWLQAWNAPLRPTAQDADPHQQLLIDL